MIKENEKSFLGKELVKLRKTKTLVCPVCNKKKHKALMIAKYCSNKCKQRAFINRKKNEKNISNKII